jgi:hypothetical protein
MDGIAIFYLLLCMYQLGSIGIPFELMFTLKSQIRE